MIKAILGKIKDYFPAEFQRIHIFLGGVIVGILLGIATISALLWMFR